MEAAVTQLIKTAIIKAGNGPTAFAATARHCPAAGLVQLPCISPQSPRQAPQTARWSSPQAWPPPQNGTAVRGGSSGKVRWLACSFIIYVVLTGCQDLCHPFTARDSADCGSSPPPRLSSHACLPWGLPFLCSFRQPASPRPQRSLHEQGHPRRPAHPLP